MAYVDKVFKQNLIDILDQEWEVDNRAVWKDGSKPKTKRIIGVFNEYDLSKEFPILTLRPTWLKGSADEIGWIFQRRSNNINDLNSEIWNEWADEDGSIGLAYGHQINKETLGFPSQLDYVLHTAKSNPTSRRIMMNMFNVEDMPKKNLIECAYATHFSVKDGYLHTTLCQRSNDFIVANNWNVVGYAVLAHMIARHCGLKVGILKHFVQDMHIYDKHEEHAYELLKRKPYPAPVLKLDESVTNFYDIKPKHFKLENYQKHDQLDLDVSV